jgi:hypothetical protein
MGWKLGCSHCTEERRLRVFEKRVLRRIFGPRRDELTEELRKLHNEELNNLYPTPNIVRVIRSRRMRWGGHVASMGRGEAYTGFWWGNLRERDHLESPGIDGRIILRWIFSKWDVLAQERDRCRTLVNAVMNLRDAGNFLTR